MKLTTSVRTSVGLFFVSAALAASGGAVAANGDPVAGKQKTSMCAGCHGIPGYKIAFPAVYSVPKLGGQHAGYIVKALQAYRSGERNGLNHGTMRAIAAQLSDQDMADLAAYYASDAARTAAK